MAKNDWYEAGEAIRSLVQNAVENQDFTQLSTTISNVINQTVDGFQDALRDSLRGRPEDYREKRTNQPRDGRANGTGRTQDDWGRDSGRSRERSEEEVDRPRYRQESGTNYDRTWEHPEEEVDRPRYRQESRTDYGRTGRAEGTYHYRTGGMRFSGQEAAERIRRNIEAGKKEFRPAGRNVRVPGLVTGRVLAAAGYGFGSMFGLALVILAIVGDATGMVPDAVIEVMAVLTGLNLWMGVMGSRRIGLAKRFRRYMRMLRDRTWCTLEELASGTGKTISYIRKDLKKMLRRGFFPEGHLDRKETCLITDNETYQQHLLAQQEADRRAVFGQEEGSRKADGQYENAKTDGSSGSGPYGAAGKDSDNRPDRADGKQSAGQSGKTGKASAKAADGDRDSGRKDKKEAKDSPRDSLDGECRELIEEGERYIAHIRMCNDKISGEEMSAKLDRLELVVTRIFREVERRPELAPELRRMMSYYLPTTQKLIDAYCQFDEQPIRGQNIDSTKKEIESALDTINQAFENLLDGFFENTAWDISSDISVLHTMFAQEGLTGGDFSKKNRPR